jgi:serine protease Do
MNKWIAIPISLILVAGTIANGVLYFQANGQLQDAKAHIADLEAGYGSLQGDLDLLDDSFVALSSQFSAMENDVSSLGSDVSSLQGDVSGLGDDISSLEDDVSSVEDDVSDLEDDFSGLEDDVVLMDAKLAGAEGDISLLSGDVSSLENDVASAQGDIADLQAYNRAVQDVVDSIMPAAVVVVTDLGNGSGIIVTNDGWVLTNYHVLDGAAWADIYMTDGPVFSAEPTWWYSTTRDIALLKIDYDDTFPVALLGSSDDIVVGEEVVTLGFPMWPDLSEAPTVNTGIVSAIQPFSSSEMIDLVGDGVWIQHDATINYGNSGGPLLNLQGEVIGINTLSFKYWYDAPWVGLNFSIPIDEAKALIEVVTG